MSYPVVMTDNSIFHTGSYRFPINGMKKNHEFRNSKSGVKYIVNLCNGTCYIPI